MSNLHIIEEEIAKLEEEQRSNQSKLALLRKSKTAMLEQAEEDRKSSELNKLEKSISVANDLVKDTSLRFEHDQILEAVLVKLGESHIDSYILTRDLDLMKIENFLDLFSRNVKTIEKIFSTFDRSSDYIRINFDDQNFTSMTFIIFGRAEDIKITAKDDSHLTVELTKGIEYQSDKVVIKRNGIEYGFYMVDSYDSFYVDATVSGVCSIDKFIKKFEHLSMKLAKAEIIEKD